MGQQGRDAVQLHDITESRTTNKYTDFQLLSKIHPKFWLGIPNIEISKNQ